MPKSRFAGFWLVVALWLPLAACNNQAYLILSIEDPEQVAAEAVAVALGAQPDDLTRFDLEGRHFPVTQTLQGTPGAQRSLWIDALDSAGQALGRTHITVQFKTNGTATATATLGRACEDDTTCDNGVFCDGTEHCADRVCVGGEAPCAPSPYDCVEVTCLEDASDCAIALNHDLCEPIAASEGGEPEATYCDARFGCIPGDACEHEGAPCPSAQVCGAPRTCLSGRCVVSGELQVDDGNPCTLDYCDESEGVVHPADPRVDGNTCEREAGLLGMCLAGACVESRCGDGFRDPQSEECDEGPLNSDSLPDACRSDCRLPRCGDGVTDLGEDCDDGNDIDNDACLTSCEANTCGDGFRNPPTEACDDGNSSDQDACLTSCEANTCGDGHVQLGVEDCDDGNQDDNDPCLADCTLNTCGDGHLNRLAEGCDDGNQDNNDACLASCEPNVCGDGILNPLAEQCDDGNPSLVDACLPSCIYNICGDGIRDLIHEACDDGNLLNLDGCSEHCDDIAWMVDLAIPVASGTNLVAWSYTEQIEVTGPPDGDAGSEDGGIEDAAAADSSPRFVERDVDVLGVLGADGEIRVVDMVTGVERWRASLGKSAHTPLAVGRHGVYALTDDGHLYGFDFAGPSAQGQARFEASLGEAASVGGLSVAQGAASDILVAVAQTGQLFGFDDSGSPFDFSTPYIGGGAYPHSTKPQDHDSNARCDHCAVTLSGDTDILRNDVDYGVQGVLEPMVGELWLWLFRYNDPPVHMPLPEGTTIAGRVAFKGGGPSNTASNGDPAYARSRDGHLMRIVARGLDGPAAVSPVITHMQNKGYQTEPVVVVSPFTGKDLVIVAASDGAVHMLQAREKPNTRFAEMPTWPFVPDEQVHFAPAVDVGFKVYIVDDAGSLYAVTGLTGELRWRHETGEPPASSPLVAHNGVFVLTQSGKLWAFEHGDSAPPRSWWSREGGNNQGSGAPKDCRLGGDHAWPASIFLVLLLLVRRRRHGRRALT